MRWRSSFRASAAAKIGQAEIATMIAKSNASITNSQLFSVAKYFRLNWRNDLRTNDRLYWTLSVMLTIVPAVFFRSGLFTVITLIVERWINRRENGVRLQIVKNA